MTYYKDKRRAIAIIDNMLIKGIDEAQIELKISRLFGFGPKLINDRKALLKRLNGPQNENN